MNSRKLYERYLAKSRWKYVVSLDKVRIYMSCVKERGQSTITYVILTWIYIKFSTRRSFFFWGAGGKLLLQWKNFPTQVDKT